MHGCLQGWLRAVCSAICPASVEWGYSGGGVGSNWSILSAPHNRCSCDGILADLGGLRWCCQAKSTLVENVFVSYPETFEWGRFD